MKRKAYNAPHKLHSSTTPEYIKVQREVNTKHTDGSLYYPHEEVRDKVRIMCGLFKKLYIVPDSALFVGCRMGCEMLEFQEHYPVTYVAGVDLVPEFVKVANERVGEALVADAHNLEMFGEDDFDVVFSSQTLEHCYDVELAVSEMVRVAKSVVYLSVPLEDRDKADRNPSHCVYTENPINWIDLFKPHTHWRLQWAGLTSKNCFDILVLHIGEEFEK